MTLALKVPLKKAEAAKRTILSNNVIDKNFKIKKDSQFIYFPIFKKINDFPDSWFVEEEFEKVERMKTFKERLMEIFTKKEIKKIKRAYDLIGNVALLEVDKELIKKEKKIARLLIETNKSIKGVFRKGKHIGKYRVIKLKWIAGDKNTEVVHRESGLLMKLDLKKVYFSQRLAAERLRISRQVKQGEKILVMFSGCAPFPLIISRHSKASEIYGIEANPVAHRYAIENVRLNRIKNIKLYCGDVRKIVPKLNIKFDRIVMPRPKLKDDFLDVALDVIKSNGVIHFYDFVSEKDIPEKVSKKINNACNKKEKRCKILRIVKCGQPAPRTLRICADFVVFER